LIFDLVLTVQSKLIFVFQNSFFYSWNACWLHVLYCSNHPQLFLLDSVTTAVWLISFDQIITSVLCRILIYAPRIHKSLDSSWLKFLYFPTQVLKQYKYSRKSRRFPNLRICLRFQLDASLYLQSFVGPWPSFQFDDAVRNP
jgi:hypothetical protein